MRLSVYANAITAIGNVRSPAYDALNCHRFPPRCDSLGMFPESEDTQIF